MDLLNITGKTVLITGASSGIGQHFVNLFLSAGARVILSSRKITQLDLVNGYENKMLFLDMDVSIKTSVLQAFIKLEEAGEKIDIAVHCAGICNYTPIFKTDESDDFDKLIQTNLQGTWYVNRAVAKHMKQHQIAGSIINMGSVSGDAIPANGGAGYCVSKAAIMHLTKSLVGELSPYKIRINTISTWMIPTPMTLESIEKNNDKIVAITPLGLAKLDDLDGVVMFLASNKASRYVTGSCITVDGGVSWGACEYFL